MTPEEVKQQSENAYNQWCKQWREHASIHSKFPQRSIEDFTNIGIGRAVLCVANGRSFEDNIETIKANQNKVDIMCCDKTLGHLLNNGIAPTYCMVCDANVNYEKYLKPYENQLQNTILFINACGNPEWSKNGNWKHIYFFINKDILKSEQEFSKLSGCKNFIPAGTNVSNAMVVFLTQSDETGARNFFGYDKILLIGYDYSWTAGKYYAFNPTGDGKDNYMRHINMINGMDEPCFTSGNLFFSLQWIDKYVKVYQLPVVQCSNHSIYSGLKQGDLKQQMNYNFDTSDYDKVQEKIKIRENLLRNLGHIDQSLADISRKHSYNFLATT